MKRWQLCCVWIHTEIWFTVQTTIVWNFPPETEKKLFYWVLGMGKWWWWWLLLMVALSFFGWGDVRSFVVVHPDLLLQLNSDRPNPFSQVIHSFYHFTNLDPLWAWMDACMHFVHREMTWSFNIFSPKLFFFVLPLSLQSSWLASHKTHFVPGLHLSSSSWWNYVTVSPKT